MKIVLLACGAALLGMLLLAGGLLLAGRRELCRARRRGRPFHWNHADPAPDSLSAPGDSP